MRIRPDILITPFCIGTVCALVLLTAMVPGKVEALMLSSFEVSAIGGLSVILGTIGWLVWTMVQLGRRKIRFCTKRVYQPLISLLLVLLTCTAIAWQVPTKVGFWVSYRSFQRAIVTSAVQPQSRVGLFRLERVQYPSTKWKSGVHFQLLSSEGGGGGASYYGISYRPDLKSGEMPFGFVSEKSYDRIFGNWYIFHALTC